jgi:Zn-dependent protease with chaperone function
MDFFQSQERARKRSQLLIALFALTVVGVAAGAFGLFGLLLQAADDGSGSGPAPWTVGQFVAITAIVLLVMGAASAIQLVRYRQGGGAVARSLGGRQVLPTTRDPAERKLYNVVEEMALASGIPVPEVYLLEDESGINAFAAGQQLRDAAIGVTRGCVDKLSRDELQGVIAHEFSHVLNGDMRINLRLAAAIFGIMVLALVGRVVLRSALYARGGRRNSKDNSALVLLAVGGGLLVLGVFGEWMGRIIQAAISRQREFLADAAAVQFTRNPDGIGGALIRIGADAQRGKVGAASAAPLAHMFFASCMSRSLGGVLATHPPLPLRIRAVMPQWDGTFTERAAAKARSAQPATPAANAQAAAQSQRGAGLAMIGAVAVAADAARGAAKAQRLPAVLAESIHDGERAPAVWLGLVLDADDRLRSRQLELVSRDADTASLVATLRAIFPAIASLKEEERMSVIELLLPTLRSVPTARYQQMLALGRQLIESDGILHHNEAMLWALSVFWCTAARVGDPLPRIDSGTAKTLVLTLVATADGAGWAASQARAVAAAARHGLSLPSGVAIPNKLALLDAALAQLRALPVLKRKTLLTVVRELVAADGVESASERHWHGMLALVLDCPATVVN